MSKKTSPRGPQFPDRIVLAVGFPWAKGIGTKDHPYDSVMMLKHRHGGLVPKVIRFPVVLWKSQGLPRYRLVLERVRAAKKDTKAAKGIAR